jgi:hypothetical protein
VSEQIIDTITRRAAGAVSRRTSLLALGGMALVAVTAAPSAAKGGKKGKKPKKRKGGNGSDGTGFGPLAQARCASQVDQCRAIVTDLCEDAECLGKIVCCAPLATCNADGALACLFPAN